MVRSITLGKIVIWIVASVVTGLALRQVALQQAAQVAQRAEQAKQAAAVAQDKEIEVKKSPKRLKKTTTSTPSKTIEVIAKPDQWSENFSVPPGYCFEIHPKGKIRIRFSDGKEINDEPGKIKWLGNDVRKSNFSFMSREDKDVKVKIDMRPN